MNLIPLFLMELLHFEIPVSYLHFVKKKLFFLLLQYPTLELHFPPPPLEHRVN